MPTIKNDFIKEYMTHQFNNHQIMLTEDGSNTFFSEKYQENCHSLSGAKAETEFHYINGCQILKKAEQGDLNLLEVGLGTGLGLFLTIEHILKLETSFSINLYSLEESDELINYFTTSLSQNYSHLCPELIESNELYNAFKIKKLKLRIYILKGDARQSLLNFSQQMKLSLNAIYQDAFSPKKNPSLWTVEWFSLLKVLSQEDCLLSTYSSSISIQKSLIKAGWKIYNGGPFGRKRSCTRAKLTGESA
ncbi:MnmC family methyltransferase, partial [Bacteriovoracaceae bacterium]|nr:MnmC family methyltransferase [Bacteriovoracaceae bacterium]